MRYSHLHSTPLKERSIKTVFGTELLVFEEAGRDSVKAQISICILFTTKYIEVLLKSIQNTVNSHYLPLSRITAYLQVKIWSQF